MHWYRDTKEHLNYFLYLPIPVLLIICDPDSRECFWAALKKENVEFKGDSWHYPIPKTEKLDKQSANKIENIFGSMVYPDGRSGPQIAGKPKESEEFMSECFDGLNKASDKWDWPTIRNYQISKLIHNELFPGIPFPDMENNA